MRQLTPMLIILTLVMAGCGGGGSDDPPPADNQAPTVSGSLSDQSALVDQAFEYTFPTDVFSDPDSDALTLSASGLPAGLSFDATAPGSVSGTPTAATSAMVTVTATDPDGLSANTSFTITVTVEGSDNLPPTLSGSLTDQTATVGMAFTYDLPAGLFTDPNGDTLTLSATGLPAGLSFDASGNGSISGMPTTDGTVTVTITASDPDDASASGSFMLTVNPAADDNNAPVADGSIAEQSATVGTPFSLDLPADLFSDPDGDELTLTASALPAGLSFDASGNGSISGTPTTSERVTVTITATDPDGESASVSFDIVVSDGSGNTPPRVAGSVSDQTATVGVEFHYDITDLFADDDGDELTLSANGLPPGVTLMEDSIIHLHGTPTTAGTYEVSLTADDGNATVSVSFTISVTESGGGGTDLVIGDATVDTSTAADGYIMISFPDAEGDGPMITGITAPVDEVHHATIEDGNEPGAADGLKVYLPREGDYTFTVTISDPGDDDATKEVPVTIAVDEDFTINGDVADMDGATETAVTTDAILYWLPDGIAVENAITVESQKTNQVEAGQFSFPGLLGTPSIFQVEIAGGGE